MSTATASKSTRSTSSPRRLAANRANALKSTGPRTEPGKARSAANAARHGFYTDRFAINADEGAAFEEFRDTFVRACAARDELERLQAERIAGLQWRLRRVEAAQNQLLRESAMTIDEVDEVGEDVEASWRPSRALIDVTGGDLDPDDDTFVKLTQIEHRLDTQLQRAWRQLRVLQHPDRPMVYDPLPPAEPVESPAAAPAPSQWENEPNESANVENATDSEPRTAFGATRGAVVPAGFEPLLQTLPAAPARRDPTQIGSGSV